MGDTEGERLARLEVKVDELVRDMRDHLTDHRDATRDAREAKETAKQAALQASIGYRSDRTMRVCAYIGGGFMLLIEVIQLARSFV